MLLIFAGSHESCTADLDSCHDVSPDCPSFARDLTGVFGTAVNAFIYNWSVTQTLDIREQLDKGIRFLDLRVSSKPDSDELYFSHGLYAHPVKEGMAQVADFLHSHTKEIVLLDFNHFYDMSLHQHEYFVNLLLEIFGSKLVPLLDMESVTLHELWDNQLQVIIFYHNEIVSTNFQLWPGSYVPTPWADTYNMDQLFHFLENNYNKCRPKDKFYVTQGISTPDTTFIMKNLFNNLRDTVGCPSTKRFMLWAEKKESGPTGLNICIVDFVEHAHFISTIIDLNHRMK